MAEMEYPDQSYFPSCKVRFAMRFEEGGDVEPVKEKSPKKVTTTLKGTKDDSTALEVIEDPNAPAGVKRFLISDSAEKGKPQEQDQSADKFTDLVGAIVPSSASLCLNGLRTADTLKLTIPYRDFPFDPRAIRSCAIEFYLGTIKGDDYAKAHAGYVIGDAGEGTGAALAVLPDKYTDDNGQERTNLRFQGWADEITMRFDQDNEPEVFFECRDNTSMLIEQEAPPKLVIGAKDPIDKAVATYLSNFPQFAGLTVEYRPSGAEPPTLDSVLGKSTYKPELGPPPAKGGGGSNTLKVWDYLADISGALGLSLRLEGTNIIIQPVISLTKEAEKTRLDDPYKPRELPSGKAVRRRMIYGRNLTRLEVTKKLAGRGTPTNVEVRCYKPSEKRTLVVRFPEKGDTVIGKAQPGNGKNQQKWLVWRVSGIEDEATLKVVAQSIYESVGRNEIKVTIKTANLSSFGGGNTDPDLLDLKAGDPIDVFTNRDDTEELSTMTQIEQVLLVSGRAKDYLASLGYGASIADAYAKAYSDQGFQSTLRCKQARIEWDVNDGVGIQIDGINYVEVRAFKKDVAE